MAKVAVKTSAFPRFEYSNPRWPVPDSRRLMAEKCLAASMASKVLSGADRSRMVSSQRAQDNFHFLHVA